MKRFWNFQRVQPQQGPSKWVPILGELQKTLQQGEYLPLRPLPMFESNFVQVTNHGGPALVHHRTNKLTMGVAASLPSLMLPDLLLIARPVESRDSSSLTLTRMIPLDLAHLYVHDLPTWRLKLRLVTGRYYYLELDAPEHELAFLFDRWIRLINLLHQPAMSWAPRTMHIPPLGTSLAIVPASTWHFQDQVHDRCSGEVTEPVFPYKMLTSQKQKKAKCHAFKRGLKSQAVGDSLPLLWSHMERPELWKKSTDKKSHLDAHPDTSKTKFHVSEKTSITIRTIFSIINSTLEQTSANSKASYEAKTCICNSEGVTDRGNLIETPSHCISGDNSDLPVPASYNQPEALLWPKDIEDLRDPDSSNLSSPLYKSTRPPVSHPPPPRPPFPRSTEKARHVSPRKHQAPRPSQKAQSARVTPQKAPLISSKSHKVPAVPGSPRKYPVASAPNRKTPAAPWSRQKALSSPGFSMKTLPISAVPQKNLVTSRASQKAPVLCVPAQKILPPIPKFPPAPVSPHQVIPSPATKEEYLVQCTPPQKAPILPHQYEAAVELPLPWVQASGDLGLLLADAPEEHVLERSRAEGKQEPVVLVGGQETKMIEARAQTKTMEVPFTRTKEESKEVLVSKIREGLKSGGEAEDRPCRTKQEMAMDFPGTNTEEANQQKRWVITQKLAIEGPDHEDKRPFSVEGLALAKLMILANSKHQSQKATTISIPSWLAMGSQGAALSKMTNFHFNSSEMSLLEGTPAVVKGQPEAQAWVKENTQQWAEKESPWDPVGASEVPIQTIPTSDSPKMVDTFQGPIPLPATQWENLPQEPHAVMPISKSEEILVRKQSPLSEKIPSQHPPAMTAGTSDTVLPILLEMENVKDMSPRAEMKEEQLGIHHPSPQQTAFPEL